MVASLPQVTVPAPVCLAESERPLLQVAERLAAKELTPADRSAVMAWAQEVASRPKGGISALDHLMVARALRTFSAAFDDGERAQLRALYDRGHLELAGKAAPADAIVPLPPSALGDRRARVLQNAIFEERGLLAGYKPTWGQAMAAGAAVALCVATPFGIPLAAGLLLSSLVENQIHHHIMHAKPETIRLMYRARSGILKWPKEFHFVHEAIHHGQTFLENDTTKFRGGDRTKLDQLLARVGKTELAEKTDDGLQLFSTGAAFSAVQGPTAVALAGVAVGLSLPTAVLLGLPMALMPLFPHWLHRYAHMSHAEADKYLADLAASDSTFDRVKSAVIGRFVRTPAFEGLARLHNHHHHEIKRDRKVNMSMMFVADAMLGQAERASYELLVSLWKQDAVGFPTAPKSAA